MAPSKKVKRKYKKSSTHTFDDLQGTIDPFASDSDDGDDSNDSEAEQLEMRSKKQQTKTIFSSGFSFGGLGESTSDRSTSEIKPSKFDQSNGISGFGKSTLEDKIRRVRAQDKFRPSEVEDVEDEESDTESSEDDENDEESNTERTGTVSESTDIVKLNPVQDAKAKEAAEYFDVDPSASKPSSALATSFLELNLSRPLLKATTAMGYQRPTPIQARSIPLALAGRDICASAQTGSGKTAAFLLPVLERLLYRSRRGGGATRVLIVSPTRELASQIHTEAEKLSSATDILSALIVGGLSLGKQEAALRARPDIVVGTPGRLVDHLRNSSCVHFDDVEVLVLDEADRLLDMGFEDELHELLRFCPKALIKMSLNRPVRICVDDVTNVADRLVQEFIRIRKEAEDSREAVVVGLIARSFKKNAIVFCASKVAAHRLVIVLGILGIKAAELHGNLTQTQRAEALRRFKNGKVTILIATDLAGRGLDIPHVATVINMSMPREHTRYVHRVGRTARAGRSGRAVSLVGEKGRAMMKLIVKKSSKKGTSEVDKKQLFIRSRVVPPKTIAVWKRKIAGIEDEVTAVLDMERAEKAARVAEMEVNKASNLMMYEDDIARRPKRTWFKSSADKEATRVASKEDYDRRGYIMIDNKKVERSKLGPAEKELLKLTSGPNRKLKNGMGIHRLSRQKRRRRELDAAMDDGSVEKMLAQQGRQIRQARKARERGETTTAENIAAREKRKKLKDKAMKAYIKKKTDDSSAAVEKNKDSENKQERTVGEKRKAAKKKKLAKGGFKSKKRFKRR